MNYRQKVLERKKEKIISILDSNTYPTEFNKSKWEKIKKSNCYAYALDIPVSDKKTTLLIPGCISDSSLNPAIFSIVELIARLKQDLDFLGISYREENSELYEGEWRVAIYYIPTWHDFPIGFHMARQDADGSWSEKPSWDGEVRKIKEKSDEPPVYYGKMCPKLECVLVLKKHEN